MISKLTPYYIDLVYDATLKSYWRKISLRKFLRECGISENFLATWSEDETKRGFLDRLFEKLRATDKGRDAILRISDNLMEQRSFPDLLTWEDSDKKIKDAHDAVGKLRSYHQKQEEEIENIKEKEKFKEEFRERQERVTRSQQTIQKLNERLSELGKQLGSQQAGYDFQDWFYDLLDFFEIVNRRPYVHDGRQIDGSLTYAGTTYLIELKFTTEQSSVIDIDSFYRKVTTKADNTMGIMVSISGYSSNAKQDASSERTPLLLLDHQHIYCVLSGIMGMGDLIERIRRHASQTGEAYLTPDKF